MQNASAPFDTNLSTWEKTKETKYGGTLIPQLEEAGWNVDFAHLGVGAMGTIPKSTKDSMFSIAKFDPSCSTVSHKEMNSICLTRKSLSLASLLFFVNAITLTGSSWVPRTF